MGEYFNGQEQNLNDILKAREERVQYQQFLINTFEKTVVSYKLNIPGPVKYNPLVKQIFDEGITVLKQKLSELSLEILHEKVDYRNSGPEYFAVVNTLPHLVKRISTNIENLHPLGRLYDFDVLDSEGLQISRLELGLEERKCLLCSRNAFECGRARNHKISDLVEKIERMALDYFNTKCRN